MRLFRLLSELPILLKWLYIRLGLFKIVVNFLEVIYRLNLPAKIKIYPIQYITILELAYRDIELLVYKADTYRG